MFRHDTLNMFSRRLLEATMIAQGPNAKAKILAAVRRMLTENGRPLNLTIRQIADRAGVGVGTINYHFQTKDRLIYGAVNSMLVSMADSLTVNGTVPQDHPFSQLRDFLVATSDLLIEHFGMYKLHIQYELVLGNMKTPSYLLPLLDKACGGRKSEQEIKLIALQLVSTMQVIFLQPESFKTYCGIDIFDKGQRDTAIDIMLSNIIPKRGE
jgi:AcrR family transcriptional regulator